MIYSFYNRKGDSMEEKKKVGMSGLNWFLSIIGILFFVSFIVLPPIFRSFIDEEVGEEPNTNVVESPSPTSDSSVDKQVNTIKICTKYGDRVDNSYLIQSQNDVILMFAQTDTTHYLEGEDFSSNCDFESSLYQNIPGFYHACRVEGNDMIVESRVQIDDKIPENIPISYDLTQKASELEQQLVTNGFTCEDSENQ